MLRLPETLSFLGRETLRIVLSSPCVACGSELPLVSPHASCCAACWGVLPRIEDPRCRRCATPWVGSPFPDADFLCLECAGQEGDPLERIDAWGEYRDGLERVLQAFKFRRHDFLDRPLNELLLERWDAWPERRFDVVVPVPLHPRRLRARGYNQAELLARPFSLRTGLPLRPSLLVRTADTAPQSSLQREDRMRNVRRAFRGAEGAKDRRILLIDDVCTTGSTLRASAKALLKAGAESVSALVVARA